MPRSRSRRRLSKSRFTAGLQCQRQLWWKVHEPRAPELKPDASLQAVFDMGNRVGARAREEFPGATLIELDYRRTQAAVDATRRAIEAGADVILEASFLEDQIFVAVDVLSKEGEGWVVTEVKATTKVKPQHIPDAAVQAHVVERNCQLHPGEKQGRKRIHLDWIQKSVADRAIDVIDRFVRLRCVDDTAAIGGELFQTESFTVPEQRWWSRSVDVENKSRAGHQASPGRISKAILTAPRRPDVAAWAIAST